MSLIKIVISLFLSVLVNNAVFAADSAITYDDTEKLLRVNVEQVSLQYLLGRISEKTGFEVLTAVDFDLETRVSADMTGSVHQLLPRLLRGMSVIVYEGDGDNKSTIWIIPQGADQSDYLSTGKMVKAVAITGSESVQDLKHNERRRDIGREDWQLKKAAERAVRKQQHIESETEN